MKRILNFYWGEGIFWFRIFGRGLHFKNTRKCKLYFSERNGYTKRLQIGRLSIRCLKKEIHGWRLNTTPQLK